MSTPASAVKILRRIDDLYVEARLRPRDQEVKGQLRAYTQSFAWITGMTYDDAKAYVVARQERREQGLHAPRIDTWAAKVRTGEIPVVERKGHR